MISLQIILSFYQPRKKKKRRKKKVMVIWIHSPGPLHSMYNTEMQMLCVSPL